MESFTNLLFFDVDATGKNIYDELVCLSLTNQKQVGYNSFIMPSCNFTEKAMASLKLSITNTIYVRVMKDKTSWQAVSTKSLYIVMKELLVWLKQNNTQKSKFCMMYCGLTNLPALLLLKSLKGFKLYDEFKNEVEYIINLNEFFKQSVINTLTTDDPKIIFSVLLNVEEKDINISRAGSRLSFVQKVFNHLLAGMDKQEVTNRLSEHARLLPDVSDELDSQLALLEKKSSLDPIFKKLFSEQITRAKYVKMRNDLVDNGISYAILKEKFEEDSLKEFVEEKLKSNEETINIIMNHFTVQKPAASVKSDVSAPE